MFFRAHLVILAASAVLLAQPALAQFVDEEPVGRLTIGGGIGFVSSSMTDVNNNLRVVDDFLTNDEIRNSDKITQTLLTSLDVRYRLKDSFSLGLAWGALQNRSEFDAVTRATMRFFSRTTTYTASAYYHFPGVVEWNERLQIYAGAGFMLLRNGLIEWSFQDNTVNFWSSANPPPPGDLSELSGRGRATASGSGFHLTFGSSLQFSPRFSGALDLGWRMAKLSGLEIDDNDIEGFREYILGDPEETREPGDWAIYDFFYRHPDANTPDGRNRNDPQVPGEDKTGCEGCPLYYTGGELEVDYGGPYAQIVFRIHF